MLAEGMEALDFFEVAFSSGLRLKLTDLGVPCVDVFVVIFAFFVADNDSWEVADLLATLLAVGVLVLAIGVLVLAIGVLVLAAGVLVFAGSGGVLAAVLTVAGVAIKGTFEFVICF